MPTYYELSDTEAKKITDRYNAARWIDSEEGDEVYAENEIVARKHQFKRDFQRGMFEFANYNTESNQLEKTSILLEEIKTFFDTNDLHEKIKIITQGFSSILMQENLMNIVKNNTQYHPFFGNGQAAGPLFKVIFIKKDNQYIVEFNLHNKKIFKGTDPESIQGNENDPFSSLSFLYQIEVKDNKLYFTPIAKPLFIIYDDECSLPDNNKQKFAKIHKASNLNERIMNYNKTGWMLWLVSAFKLPFLLNLIPNKTDKNDSEKTNKNKMFDFTSYILHFFNLNKKSIPKKKASTESTKPTSEKIKLP